MEERFSKLAELGAGDFQHIDGELIEHLRGTRELLDTWGASRTLQDAGLYHAAYGTAGFEQSLVSIEQRGLIAEVIGAPAERIVYEYCACDRQDFWPRVGIEPAPLFNNRFTGEAYCLDMQLLAEFCELTVANEVEIARRCPEFFEDSGATLYTIFRNMRPYLSDSATRAVETTFADYS